MLRNTQLLGEERREANERFEVQLRHEALVSLGHADVAQ